MKKALIALPLLALLLTGCGATATPNEPTSAPVEAVAPSETPETTPEATTPEEPVSASDSPVATLLNALVVADENGSAYDRELFKHWTTSNSTGCDTRFAVLSLESTVAVQTDGCKVLSGNWVSSYDGQVFTVPNDLDIDHMVPLAEAWRSGAYAWNADTREAFANDLDFGTSLIAVSASSNRSKGDKDPAKWMPDTDACSYVANWVAVKHRWSLSVDTSEKSKIESVLTWCENLTVETSTPAPITKGTAPAPETPVEEAPPVANDGASDPKFSSCKEAAANGYKGPYVKGQDVEYDYYRDGDGDGQVCE